MQKFVNKLIDNAVRKVDRYVNNGSTWLIFTQDKKWVIELTKEGTLWYNYNFFKNLFAYLSLDVVENQHYITKWVEDNIIRDGVKVTNKSLRVDDSCVIEDTVQNGVKNIRHSKSENDSRAENTIQNGVKETKNTIGKATHTIEDTIQNGVKETHRDAERHPKTVEDTIQNGVIHTRFLSNNRAEYVEHTIENGVKKTYSDKIPHEYDWSDQFTEDVEDTIQNGVKEVQPLPAQDGNMDYSNYYYRQGDRTKPHTQYVNDVIENSIKETIL